MFINKLIAQNRKPTRSFILFNGFTLIYASTYEKRVALTVTSVILNKLHLKLKAHVPHCLHKTRVSIKTHVCARLRLCQRVDEEFQIVEN